jgi:hypothetical protein
LNGGTENITKMKNAFNGLNGKLGMSKDKTGILENRSIEIIQD